MTGRAKYACRSAALSVATVCSVFFPLTVWFLLSSYNYEFHRFPPFVTGSDFVRAVAFGIGLVCSVFWYVRLARQCV